MISIPEASRRRLFCIHENDCLEFAARHDWINFSCAECYDYEALTYDAYEWGLEAVYCLKLLRSIFAEEEG